MGVTLSKTPLATVPPVVTEPLRTVAVLAARILVSSAGVGIPNALPPAKV